ncbi:hypothetical protein ACWDYJ_29880 [Streptomyces sp. NPDC003042]
MTSDASSRSGRWWSGTTLLRLASVAVGVGVAALVVVDFRLTGEARGPQVLAVALTAVCLTTVVLVTSSLTDRRLRFPGVLSILSRLLTPLAVYPLALWAGVAISWAVGLPARLTGLWPVFVSGLVVAAVATTVRIFFALFRSRTRRAGVNWLAAVALNAAGLALAALLLDGVRLDAAPGWRQALTLCVVACLFMMPRLTLSLPVPGVASLVLVAYHCLLLWLLCDLLAVTEPRLHIDGFWQLAGAAGLMWAVEWPGRLAARQGGTAPQPAPVFPDPFPPDHMFPSGPLY